MTLNTSMASAWLGGLVVWGAALTGLAAMPNSVDSGDVMAAIHDRPSAEVIAINERYVEMGLLDPSGEEVEAPTDPFVASHPKAPADMTQDSGGMS